MRYRAVEGNEIGKIRPLCSIRRVFNNCGEFELDQHGLIFKEWKTIGYDEIERVELSNKYKFSSWQLANGYRLPFCKSSRPIVLQTNSGEQIYFYVDWNYITGLSDNKRIYEMIKQRVAGDR